MARHHDDDAMTRVLERLRRLEDLQELQQLRARYCQALDDGRWEELASLFTPDGRFVGLSTATGREEMLEFFPSLNAGTVTAWWHFSANETLEVEGDRAWGQTWLLQPCVVDGASHVAAGRYEDRMRRDRDAAWRFTERKVTFFFWDELSQGWDQGRCGWTPARAAVDPRAAERARRVDTEQDS